MRITRLGRVFGAEMGPDWMVSHASYPAPVLIAPDRLRVFIASRDADGRGSVGYVDLDPDDPLRVIGVSREPCLRPGPRGSFSDRGISIGCVLPHEGALWMYYLGWNISADVPFRNTIGLAIDASGTGERFEPAFEGPLIGRSRFDPYTLTYPYVTPPARPGEPWRMIYGTSRDSCIDEDSMRHVLTEATSRDGVDWRPGGADSAGLEPGEYSLTRPWIARIAGRDHLFYSVRRKTYRVGCSVRDPDTEEWRRSSSDLLGPGGAEWENEAACYPALVETSGGLFLFHNGNGYGRTGFGVARIE